MAKKKSKKKAAPKGRSRQELPRKRAGQRQLDALPDTLDFRDRMFEATLVEVPVRIPLDDYRQWKVPILDQGTEGACTGFGLATVAHYLLRRRAVVPDPEPVSPRMLYEMAKRYDEWPGEDYSGSSARGAMKGWHKHGVCGETVFPYVAGAPSRTTLTEEQTTEAVRRPLGSYFRVNHRDLVAMHAAIAETGVLYATMMVHEGWNQVGDDGQIVFEPGKTKTLGGHAVAIVGYDERGFWIQNSWGTRWGAEGFARIDYDDWMVNGTDVWVARLGVPLILKTPQAAAAGYTAARGSRGYVFSDLRPHIISLGNNGALRAGGTFGTTESDVREIFEVDFPRLTASWKTKRLLLYAHGGLVSEDSAIDRVTEYRAALLSHEVYPLAFIWKTDFFSTLKNILEDSIRQRRPEGPLDSSKDFMLDRLDDALEPLARALSGKSQWDEMKENALRATESSTGGARLALKHLARLAAAEPGLEIHVVGHSAGAVFHAPLVARLTGSGAGEHGLKVASCTMWAPACTTAVFNQYYAPAIQRKKIDRTALFVLSDQAERDDHCANIYNKSLLYLVSHAFEATPRIPLVRDGVPIAGMEKHARTELGALIRSGAIDLVLTPNSTPAGGASASRASSHGSFDTDEATVRATLARILSVRNAGGAKMLFNRSGAARRAARRQLDAAVR